LQASMLSVAVAIALVMVWLSPDARGVTIVPKVDLDGQGNPVGWLRGRRWARLRHQYGNDGEPPGEDVIDDTISDEPLPNTGGVPLLGVGFFGFICIYAAFAVLRPVIRWDS
jgi:hypothetical protein